MTDQTESASDDYPICEDECVTWGGHADNCRVPAAILALEAKVREKDREIEVREADNREVIVDLRNHCDRLAGEVEMYRREWHLMTVERDTLKDVRDRTCAEVARLTSELAAARENEARWLWTFPADAGSILDRVQRVWRGWDGCGTWDDAIDAARRAGGEG